MRRDGKAGALMLLLLLSPVLASAQGLPPVLRRAIAASASLRFTGRRTVTVLRNGQPDRHEEIVMRDGPRVRIEFPREGEFAGQVVVEDATQRRHLIPRTNELRVLPPRREEGLQRLRKLVRAGRVSTEPGDRIAGLPTVELIVRDASANVLQRLAIEPKSGAVLSRRVYDATGVQVGGFVFTQIDLNPGTFDTALFRIDRKGVKTTTPGDSLRRLAQRSGYEAVTLPQRTGFRLDNAKLANLAGGKVLVQNYLGPGGRLSLYQLRAAVDPERLRRQGGRKLNALSWSAGGITYVLLGPQDDATLARLKGALGVER